MAHKNHWFKCCNCGYVGEEKELPQGKQYLKDKKAHACGKDECPECKGKGSIICCFTSQNNAEIEHWNRKDCECENCNKIRGVEEDG